MIRCFGNINTNIYLSVFNKTDLDTVDVISRVLL